MTGPTTFHFLGATASLDDIGWDEQRVDKLWRYNLHYFEDLNAAGADLRVKWHHDLLQRWVWENPAGIGTGWEPYPVSLRLVNWVKWGLAGNLLAPEVLIVLAAQARWLTKRLEVHLLGNHLFANAKALVFAGLFFRGGEAESWLQTGLRLLERETPEQILSDGGHFERTPMYHSLALEDLLDIYNVTSTYRCCVPERWEGWIAQLPDVIGRMRAWLAAMCHPDRQISFFNDAAMGIAPTPTELESYAVRLRLAPRSPGADGVTHLISSGYVRVQSGPATAILDVAPIGPDYLPGHAHADTLSFELSLFGRRLLVNSGTSCYGAGDERQRQRGTAAHNTVVVDGRDSTEVWSGFRAARRARPFDLQISPYHATCTTISCAHDGYRWLKGRPRHTRKWSFLGNELLIEDRVDGRFNLAVARFHLHPSVTVRRLDPSGSSLELSLPGEQCVVLSCEGGKLAIEEAWWHPQFGRSEVSTCVCARFERHSLQTRIKWGQSS
jgi:Uncharacterized protein conserved in bacteria